MAAALGDEDYTSAADEERDSDARRRDRVSNNNQQRDMTEVEPVSSMGVYEEAHCGYCEPCAFLVACRVVSCRKRWYAEMGAFQSSKTQSDNQLVRAVWGHCIAAGAIELHHTLQSMMILCWKYPASHVLCNTHTFGIIYSKYIND